MDDESTKSSRLIVNRLLDDLEDNGWMVRDYNPTVDPYEPVKITLEIEYHPDRDADLFKEVDDE